MLDVSASFQPGSDDRKGLAYKKLYQSAGISPSNKKAAF
jgi:hypothetical protein